MRRIMLLCASFALAIPRVAIAQDSLEYAVKFVCGRSSGGPVAPGTYFTSINIHNPNRDSLVFQFKIATPVIRFSPLFLGYDQVLNISCPRIRQILGGIAFAEGFAVFHSRLPLDVVTVYTAAGAGGLVTTEEVVRTPARTIAAVPACTTTTTQPWTPDTIPPVFARHGVWGANTSDVFSVGFGGTILHFNGAAWSLQVSPAAGLVTLTDVWGSSGSNVWVTMAAADSLLHYNGAIWSLVVATGGRGGTARVWGASANDVFVVGVNGAILHFNGATWSPQISGTTTDLLSVWGTSGSDVFAVGRNGTILHYNGAVWSPQPSGTAPDLAGVWGSAGNDVFAVGNGGTIRHYNGATWSPVPSGTTAALHDVWVASACIAFAVGDSGTIIRFNGSTWIPEPSGTVEPLLAVWGFAGLRVYAVGGTTNSATIRHRPF
jgi:hypothetical protein